MGATLNDRQLGPLTEADIAAAGDTRYLLDNRILNINGGVEVSQELGTTGLTMSSNNAKYGADIWQSYYLHTANTAVFTTGQVAAASFPTPLAGFPNGYQLKSTTALSSPVNGDLSIIFFAVEGYRIARLRWGTAQAQPISYGFWFYTTISGVIIFRMQNNAADTAYHHEHTVTAGWNWCSGVILGPTTGTWLATNGQGVQVAIFTSGKTATPATPDVWGASQASTPNNTNLHANNNNTCIVTGLTMVPGTATPNSSRLYSNMRTFDEELVLCQRYYEKSFDYATNPAQNAGAVGASQLPQPAAASSGSAVPGIRFLVRKRADPAVTIFNPSAANAQIRNLAISADWSGTTIGGNGETGFGVTGTTPAASAVGHTTAFHWVADARL